MVTLRNTETGDIVVVAGEVATWLMSSGEWVLASGSIPEVIERIGFLPDPLNPGFYIPGGTNVSVIVNGENTNVKASPYNATGAGSLDDTAAIHAARDAAGAKTLYFPPGTYRTIGGLTANVAGQTWYLAQGATIIVDTGGGALPSSGSACAIRVSADNVSILGPGKITSLTSPADESTGYSGVFVDPGADDVVVRGVEIAAGRYGVRVKGGTGTVCKRPKITDNIIHNTIGHGVFLNWETEDAEVSGNRIYSIGVASTGGNGIYAGNGSVRPRITDNAIANVAGMGIEVNGDETLGIGANPIVTDNTIYNSGDTGLSVDHTTGGIVNDNIVINSGGAPIAGGYGIELARGRRFSVEGNYVESTRAGFAGISINVANDGGNDAENTVLGNTIVASGGWGIAGIGTSVGDKHSRTKVIGNTIIDPAASGGILCQDPRGDTWIISTNQIYFSTTARTGIDCEGPGSLVATNIITYAAAIAAAASTAILITATALNCNVIGNIVNGNSKVNKGITLDTAVTGVLVDANRIDGTAQTCIDNSSSSTTNQISNNLVSVGVGAAFTMGGAVGVGNKLNTDAFARNIGAQRFDGNIGFYATTPIAKPTVTGSRGGNAALASLLTQLAALGLITDSSSA